MTAGSPGSETAGPAKEDEATDHTESSVGFVFDFADVFAPILCLALRPLERPFLGVLVAELPELGPAE